jgi:hypothetical protein
MKLQHTSRSAWSLLLTISVVLWSAALYADHMSGSAQVCHESMPQASHHQCGSEAETQPACDSQVDSTPCCPRHLASAPQQCESAHECCLWDGKAPVTPALVLASHHSPSKQLQYAVASTNVAAPPLQSAVLLSHDTSADIFTKPVEQKKTDLRI